MVESIVCFVIVLALVLLFSLALNVTGPDTTFIIHPFMDDERNDGRYR